MRKCNMCGMEKELIEFRKKQIWRSRSCKNCLNSLTRTGKENMGRFKKGRKAPSTCFKPGHISWNLGKTHSKETREKLSNIISGRKLSSEHIEAIRIGLRKSVGRKGWKAKNWANSVKERDNWKCKHCGIEEKEQLQAHHLIPWHDSVELRFELSNGITLCRSCHRKEEYRINPWNTNLKGKKLSDDHKAKISAGNKGKTRHHGIRKGALIVV